MRIEPFEVVQDVERWCESELENIRKYTNREPMDETTIYGIHELAAKAYARGYADGRTAEAARSDGARRRMRQDQEKSSE
ncbi:hypothetical protein [Microbacterium sp. YY-01]|uniref:hypothetical protein n=1 Tax=Microbacterium sp. YY-01 TaxID=3421634 RepID=UPI003D16A74E